ncbi:carboxypeptidase-like regulatory domain-containing protein [Granulicella cerasi]|uniref:Carboxypeptidase-like regulatory domain-containing protein n=1 Tax=Granulicella cerasi TaxID=741063 RepID=A0ABW1ZE55_9BACT|nr:carboxypeptidase-like regulatory domain-containing protein [Granulicella cerasi]
MPVSSAARAQSLPNAPSTQLATTVTGSTVDPDQAAIPHAEIVVDGATPADHLVFTSDDSGSFTLHGLHAGVAYTLKAQAKGFTQRTLAPFTLSGGQTLELNAVVLSPAIEEDVDAITSEQAAAIEVKEEETQRVFGLIPNFYVVYPNQPYAPLTTKLKFELVGRTLIDPVTLGAAAFAAGLNQAADRPAYVQGAKGYGQRVGAEYADGAVDIIFGGAILPTIFHQDPRYFVQGTGTTKDRLKHALSAPFITKGDNGKNEFNISSIGGDLISGAASNIYYPPSDRGVSLTFTTAAVITGGRMLNTLLQEFVLAKYTSGKHHAK